MIKKKLNIFKEFKFFSLKFLFIEILQNNGYLENQTMRKGRNYFFIKND